MCSRASVRTSSCEIYPWRSCRRDNASKVASAQALGRLSSSKDEDESDKPAEAVDRRAGVSFTRITLHLDDGAFLVVEEDGEVWRVEQRSRTLVRALTAGELDQVRSLLGAAKALGESASGGLIVESARGRKTYAVPSADSALAQLVRLIADWASPPRR